MRCCVQNSWKLSDGKSVKACVIYTWPTKTFFGSLSNCGYCADHAESLLWPAPNICLTTFQISSKSVHFQRSYSRPREGRSKCAIKAFQSTRQSIASHRVKYNCSGTMQKTCVPGLLYDAVCVIIGLAVLGKLRLVADRQMDGQTDTWWQHIPH